MALVVGYERVTYAEQRLILGAVPEYAYLQLRPSAKTWPDFFTSNKIYNSTALSDSRVSLVHLFNQINYGSTPFVTTFEYHLPRYDKDRARNIGINLLARPHCRGALALSEAALQVMRLRLGNHPKAEAVLNKTHVLHPPQPLIANVAGRFTNPHTLRLIFVGRDFFRKGGYELLRACHAARRDFPHFTLTTVSDLTYISPVARLTPEEYTWCRRLLADNEDWIHCLPGLPNTEVLRLMAESHVGLLPSLAETYGYACLEMQAAGTPVITTNIAAFPEINPPRVGWQLHMPDAAPLYGLHDVRHVQRVRHTLFLQLTRLLRDIFSTPSVLREKSLQAQQRIRNVHDPKAYADRLRAVYHVC